MFASISFIDSSLLIYATTFVRIIYERRSSPG